MTKYILTTLISIFLVGCSTLEIQTDYNTEYNFSKLSKFDVTFNKKDDGKDFARSQTSRALTNKFKEMGYYNSSKQEADFYVVLHLDIQTKQQIETNYQTMDMYPNRHYYEQLNHKLNHPIYAQHNNINTIITTQTYEYKESYLIVELVDAKSNDIFWQGSAEDELSNLSTQKEKSEYINMVIGKLLKDFPKK